MMLKKIFLLSVFFIPLANLGMETNKIKNLLYSFIEGSLVGPLLLPEILTMCSLYMQKKNTDTHCKREELLLDASEKTKEFVQEQLRYHGIDDWKNIKVKMANHHVWASSDLTNTIFVKPYFLDGKMISMIDAIYDDTKVIYVQKDGQETVFDKDACLLQQIGICDHEIYHLKHRHMQKKEICEYVIPITAYLISRCATAIWSANDCKSDITNRMGTIIIGSGIYYLTTLLLNHCYSALKRMLEYYADDGIRNDVDILKAIKNFFDHRNQEFKAQFGNTTLFKLSPSLAFYWYDGKSHPSYAARSQRIDQRIKKLQRNSVL